MRSLLIVRTVAFVGLIGCLVIADRSWSNDEVALLDVERRAMVDRLEHEVALTAIETGIDHFSPEVLEAMDRVPRHAFVPEVFRSLAYSPHPLPIHREQNIAAPFLVALMTELAAIEPGDRVFETGTGAGYHAAVMAAMGANVFSVEIIPELAEAARTILAANDIDNVRVRAGDGYFGWKEEGPFDVIVIKEAVNHIPSPLLAQLDVDGRLIVPLGSLDGPQFLTVITRRSDGTLREQRYLPVRFSPLQGGERT